MEINTSKISLQERQCRKQLKLCFYYGSEKHRVLQCPECQQQHKDCVQVSSVDSNLLLAFPPISIQVQILHLDQVINLSAMIDSGASGNFIDRSIVRKLRLPQRCLYNPSLICPIDKAPIGAGTASHSTQPLTLQTSWLHKE